MDNTYQQLLSRYGINPSTGPTPTLFNSGNTNPVYSFLNQPWNSYYPKQTAQDAPKTTATKGNQNPWLSQLATLMAQFQQQSQTAPNRGMFNGFSPTSGFKSTYTQPLQAQISQIPDILRFMKN